MKDSQINNFPYDFDHPSVNMGLYFGESESIDMLSRVYSNYLSEVLPNISSFSSMIYEDIDDKLYSPGALTYRWLLSHNIYVENFSFL